MKKMKFSEKLQKLRKENKLSQEQLADQLEVTRQAVSKWESGLTYPEMDKLLAICKLFQCSLDELTNDDIKEIKKEEKSKLTLQGIIDEVISTMLDTIHILEKKKWMQRMKYYLGILLLILFFLLMEIPVKQLYFLGENLLLSFGPKIGGFLSNLWNFILHISYVIFSVFCFYYIYKTLFVEREKEKLSRLENSSEKEEKEEQRIQKETPSQQKEEKRTQKETLSQQEKETNPSKSTEENSQTRKPFLSSQLQREIHFPKKTSLLVRMIRFLLLSFVRVCIILIALPFLFSFFLLIVAFVIDLYLAIQKIIYLGTFLLLIGFLLAVYLVLEILYNTLTSHKNSSRKIGFLLLSALVILSIGTAVTGIECSNLNFYDDIPETVTSKYKKETKTYEVPMAENSFLQVEGNAESIDYLATPEYSDKIVIETERYSDFSLINFYYDEMNHMFYISKETKFDITNKKAKELVLDGFRHREIYNYGRLTDMKVRIRTSQENINQIKKYEEEFYEKLELQHEAEREAWEKSCEHQLSTCQETVQSCDDRYANEIYNLNQEKEGLVSEIEELKEKIKELETELEEKRATIEGYETKLDALLNEYRES